MAERRKAGWNRGAWNRVAMVAVLAGMAVGVYKNSDKLLASHEPRPTPIAAEAEANHLLQEAAESIGRMVLERAYQDDPTPEVYPDQTTPDGIHILVNTDGPESDFSIFVGMEKTGDELDPANTYEVMISETHPGEDHRLKERIFILAEDKPWYVASQKFSETDPNHPVEDKELTVGLDPNKLELAKELTEKAKQLAELAMSYPTEDFSAPLDEEEPQEA